VAVLTRGLDVFTVTVMRREAESPDTNDGMLHVTVGTPPTVASVTEVTTPSAVVGGVPGGLPYDTYVRPLGKGSETETAPAESGPSFATDSVKVMLEPSGGVLVDPVFAIVTFAPACGFTDTPAEVLVSPDEFGVSGDWVSVAMFVMVPESAATSTVIDSDAESPSAMEPRVHVTVGVPATDASVTEVDEPCAVVGGTGLMRVAVSLDIVCVAAADRVAEVSLPTAEIVVPDGIPKPDTTSPTCPEVKLPLGAVRVVDASVIEADATGTAAPYDTYSSPLGSGSVTTRSCTA
jgi:hypothetical protein